MSGGILEPRAAEEDVDVYCVRGQKMLQRLIAEGKRGEKDFRQAREELEGIGKGMIDSLMERRDVLLESLTKSCAARDVSGLPADIKAMVVEFEENKQSWDDFWGKR